MKFENKVRLIPSGSGDQSYDWQMCIRDKWVTKGTLQHAILNRCKFIVGHHDTAIYCDNFLETQRPMVRSVSMFGSAVHPSPVAFICDAIPIQKCEQAILADGNLFRIS